MTTKDTKYWQIRQDGPWAELRHVGYRTDHGLDYNACGPETIMSRKAKVKTGYFTGSEAAARRRFRNAGEGSTERAIRNYRIRCRRANRLSSFKTAGWRDDTLAALFRAELYYADEAAREAYLSLQQEVL